MTYRGTIKDGVVVLEPGTQLEEGVEVIVKVVEPAVGRRSLADRLRPVIGKANGLPGALAENHDAYLHGSSNDQRDVIDGPADRE